MKRFLITGLSMVLALSVISTGVVLAVEDAESTPATTSTQAEGSTTEAEKSLAERIAKRKAELKTQLRASEKARLKAKCKASQGKISSIRGRIKGIETSRSQVYKNMLNRLVKLSDKLENKGADTTELDAAIAELQTKIETFNTDLAAYKQAVSDLADMDCEADPDGFKASLEAARTALTTVNEDALAIRNYLKDTIKELLKTIRSQLAETKPESEE